MKKKSRAWYVAWHNKQFDCARERKKLFIVNRSRKKFLCLFLPVSHQNGTNLYEFLFFALLQTRRRATEKKCSRSKSESPWAGERVCSWNVKDQLMLNAMTCRRREKLNRKRESAMKKVERCAIGRVSGRNVDKPVDVNDGKSAVRYGKKSPTQWRAHGENGYFSQGGKFCCRERKFYFGLRRDYFLLIWRCTWRRMHTRTFVGRCPATSLISCRMMSKWQKALRSRGSLSQKEFEFIRIQFLTTYDVTRKVRRTLLSRTMCKRSSADIHCLFSLLGCFNVA